MVHCMKQLWVIFGKGGTGTELGEPIQCSGRELSTSKLTGHQLGFTWTSGINNIILNVHNNNVMCTRNMRVYKTLGSPCVWSHCYLYEAYRAPPLYPTEFKGAAKAVLFTINISKENIDLENAKSVFLLLTYEFKMSP